MLRIAPAVLAVVLLIAPVWGQDIPDLDDIPARLVPDTTRYDYEKRVAMIPMRDGVKLYTVMIIPKGAHAAPMMLTRTPYNAARRAAAEDSPLPRRRPGA